MSNTQLRIELSLLKVPVSDLGEAVRYYTEGLGFDLETLVAAYGWAQLRAGGLRLALYVSGLGGGEGSPGGNRDFHLAVRSLQPILDRLQASGYPQPPVQRGDDGGEYFDLTDPDANVIRFVRAEP
jgi:catechol 2,3-dioxygenase-like lactoylglutathione lyase family enzyme